MGISSGYLVCLPREKSAAKDCQYVIVKDVLSSEEFAPEILPGRRREDALVFCRFCDGTFAWELKF